MNRVADLTGRLIDGDLTPEDARALDELLQNDPQARRLHVHLLEVDKTLRGRGPGGDVTASVMAAIRTRATGVPRKSERLSTDSSATVRPTRRQRLWSPVASLAAAAAMVLVGGVGWRLARHAAPADSPQAALGPEVSATSTVAASATVGGTVSAVTGPAILLRRGERLAVRVGAVVHAGDALETAAGGALSVTLAPATHIDLGPTTSVIIGAPFVLDSGSLSAEVAPQDPERPLVFMTPQARATVLGTRLQLAVIPGQTRLEVSRGLVLFERLSDNSSVEVSAGKSALAIEGDGQRAAARPDAGVAPSVVATTVADFNVVGDTLPSTFSQGQLVTEGCPGGRPSCVLGTLRIGDRAAISTVSIESFKPPLFRAAAAMAITFDYWMGTDANSLMLQTWDDDRGQNYRLELSDVIRGRWARAEFRLPDLRAVVDDARLVEDGDRFLNILVFGGRIGGQPFYIDNLRVLDYPPGTEPAQSATRPLEP